ncbi:MAG: asparagine synthase (glutamine-hydrolyzing) [Methanomicrobiales archaeon HGW-Methanomicrobiales-6]|jgi:asparagine synthase (glutamine-hydrolysing)|nr:MAG: asparagine synthase (glutamine-hydrolyzing) [Methanomicrobiales archaeon HGW-Methanomicrobiales-6]
MCGIVGIISKNRIATSTIKSMNDSIRHRGPDDEGYLFGGPHENDVSLPKYNVMECPVSLAFGHRRLAIVDLSPLGHQPMCYHDHYWIVYNGEIYNYTELREELEGLGYTFRSQTDTEVVLASYDAWGTECLSRFNGMWAFVFYDAAERQLFISRDRFGIKPLYYYQDSENFIFASEIKALFKHPIVTREPNIDYCKMYLKEQPRENLRETAFRDIYRFDNACFLECNIEDLFHPFREIKFWNVKPNLSNEPYSEEKGQIYARQYYDLLNDAVRLRLKADVKVGSALSGGLDSSSVVYLINQQMKLREKEEMQETFSSVYKTVGTEYCDESSFIDTVATALRVKSNQIEPKQEDIINEHRKFVYYLDTPVANTVMSSWHTYKLTRACGVTVTLDGQGADEQLAGYLEYLEYYFRNVPLSTLVQEFHRYRHTPGARGSIVRGSLLNIARHLIGENATLSLVRSIGKNASFKPLNQVLCEDLELSLETLFHLADRGSMAFSIESRMPFMDYRLVEFLAAIPAAYKVHDGWTKYIARKTFENLLPGRVCWRRDKMGWPIPEEFWFKGELKDHFLSTICSSEFLPRCGVNLLKAKEMDLFSSYSFAYLLKCYVLETWHSVFFETI